MFKIDYNYSKIFRLVFRQKIVGFGGCTRLKLLHGENNFPTKKILIESERKNPVGRKLEKKVGKFCYIYIYIIIFRSSLLNNSDIAMSSEATVDPKL